MRDLRVRFGFVLAMALLPLLLFTIWRSFDEYNHKVEDRTVIVEDAALRTVAEIVNTLDTTKAILKMASQTVTVENCQTELARITDNFSIIYNMVLADTNAKPICSAIPVRTQTPIKTALSSLTSENDFNIDIHEFGLSQSGPKNVVITSLGVFLNNELQYILRSGADLNRISSLSTKSKLLDDIHVSIFSGSGDFLIGEESLPTEVIQGWATKVIENGRHQTIYQNQLGARRDVTIIPTSEAELFVAINAPQASLMNLNKVHPISSALVPLLAWVFAFGAIWLATNKLLIGHLMPMNLAAKKFAKGDYSARVGALQDAPAQIQDLADTIDVMAERISERDQKLTESLFEKETLLREIHHRVKNNLQIIISLLNMQNRKLNDPTYTEAISETRNRINAIALVHKALYESDDIREVEMTPFLRQLISQLGRSLKVEQKRISVGVDINCAPRDADRATTIAMFIVEAMTNCVKHGVPAGGHIDIEVKDLKSETVVYVEDNGVKEGSNAGMKKGTGDRLMVGFARQLSGEYKGVMTPTGYKTSLIFPKSL